MLVIGLSGGTSDRREAVAQQLVAEGGQGLVSWSVVGRRLGDGRATSLDQSLSGTARGRQSVRGVVYTHVLTEEEAAVIRRYGGALLHLCAPLSQVVTIRQGDLMVTPKAGGDRHYLDPIEALSAVLLQRAPAKSRAVMEGGHGLHRAR